MKRKLTIGIDIDQHLAKTLSKTLKPFKDLPVRWHKPESYHVPVVQLGWIEDDTMTMIMQDLREFAAEREFFDIEFLRIVLGYKSPEDENDAHKAKSVRLEGVASEELALLEKELFEALGLQAKAHKSFVPQLRLGQMRAHAWSKLEIIPEIDRDFPLVFDVMGLTLFEESATDGKRAFERLDYYEFGADPADMIDEDF